MRHVTRHALTGAVVCAAAVGVVVTASTARTQVSAEPVQAVPAQEGPAQEGPAQEGPAQEGPAQADSAVASRRADADRANRSEVERRNGRAQVAAALKERDRSLTAAQRAVQAHDKKLQAERKAEQERRAAEERRRQARDGYDPSSATTPKEIGRQIAANKFGWTGAEFTCYDKLVMSESEWIVNATNPTSGAYGIPQSLPASKMATEGPDWRTNPATQIKWGLRYVKERYGTPCAAWSFKQGHNWY